MFYWIVKCLKCNKELVNKRADAKFCNGLCTKQYSRSRTTQTNVRGNGISRTEDLRPLKNETTTTATTLGTEVSQDCPITEHRTDCLKCSHLKRKDKIGDNENCGEQYYACKKWGVVIESYHLKMCV